MLLKLLGHRFIGYADAVILICKHSCCNQWINTAKKADPALVGKQGETRKKNKAIRTYSAL